MKNLIVLLSIIASSGVNAQIEVNISGNLFSSNEDSVFISTYSKGQYTDILGAAREESGNFTFSGSVPSPDYYVLRIGQQHVNLIIRDSKEVKVYGDGSKLGEFTNIIGDEPSNNMNKYFQEIMRWEASIIEANATIAADSSQKEAIDKKMSQEQNRLIQGRRLFIAQNRNSAALLPALTLIDAQNEFDVFETVVTQMFKDFSESETVKAIHVEYLKIKESMTADEPLAPGKEAPDFEEMLTDGSTMKLSDLRGQVVLLDFWASWCGPCRRENPNVVKLYNKYKDQGFTVMSVSLDSDKSRWLGAIEADDLSWPNHVSDLNKWASKVAKLYGVGSIPFTVLIDAEGKVIKTNLRGPALENTLSHIFDEK